MASAQNFQGVSTRHVVKSYVSGDIHTGNNAFAWVDMQNFGKFLAMLVLAVKGSSGAIDAFEIVASDAANGSTNVTVIKTHALGSSPATAGDQVFLECQAEEIEALNPAGVKLRYIAVRASTVAAADVAVCTYLQTDLRYPGENKTADYIQ